MTLTKHCSGKRSRIFFCILVFLFLLYTFMYDSILKQESRAVAGNPRDAAVIFDP